jgi:hypothetical protein
MEYRIFFLARLFKNRLIRFKIQTMQPSIEFIDHDQISAEKWNQCVNKSVLGIPQLCYAQYDYLNEISDHSWGALVVYNDNRDYYLNVMPLPYKKKWGLIHYVYQPYFCQQLGVFGQLTTLTIEDFLQAIPKRFLRIHLNIHDGIGIPRKGQKRTNYILPPPHIPTQTFNKDALKNLRKLHKHDIEYAPTANYFEILHIYDNAWGEQVGFEWFNDYACFEKALEAIDSSRIYGVMVREKSKNEILGGAIFLHSGDIDTFGQVHASTHRLHYVCGGAVNSGRELGVVHGIIEHICLQFPNSIIDFEGCNIPSVAKFYQKFGPIDEPYYAININYRLL